jgi:hypothetical protein
LLHIPLWIVLVLPFARILTTGLSIGSGGSGGIFGPGMVIGAFTGAAVWRLLEPVVPSLSHDPAPYVIVGMMSCFGSISRAPLAVMLMVAEMTGTLSLVVPAMLAVGLGTLIVRRNDDTIYRSQLRSRAESPSHRILSGLPLLAMVPVEQAMVPARCVLTSDDDPRTFADRMEQSGVNAAPFVDEEGRYVGVVTRVAATASSKSAKETAEAPIDTTFAPIHRSIHLDVVLETLTSTPQTWAAVIDDDRHVVGTVAISDIVLNYRRTMQANLRRLTELGDVTGTSEVVVASRAAIDEVALRDAGIPRGLLITAIERGRDVIRPNGSTIIRAGDRLMALGATPDLNVLSRLASAERS